MQRVHRGELQDAIHEDFDGAARAKDPTRVVDVADPEGELVAGTSSGGDALRYTGRCLAPWAGEVDPLCADLALKVNPWL